VVHWDPEGEYRGERVTFTELPLLLRRRAFVAVYRPQYANRPEDLPAEFEGLASLVLEGGRNVLVTVDEALEVLPPHGTGGLGRLLLKGRKRGISVIYATQYPSTFPRILGATRQLYLFHIDGLETVPIIRPYLNDDLLRRVAALPPHEYVTVQK